MLVIRNIYIVYYFFYFWSIIVSNKNYKMLIYTNTILCYISVRTLCDDDVSIQKKRVVYIFGSMSSLC